MKPSSRPSNSSKPKGAGTLPALVRVVSDKKDTFGSYRPRIRKVALRYADWVETEHHRKALFAAVLNLGNDDLTRQIFKAMGSGDVSLGEKLPPGWQASQVGKVHKPGTATFRDGKFIINGAGEDIWNESDSFYFIHKTMTGDATLTTQIHSQEPTAKWAKSGLMFRSDLDVDAVHAMNVISPNGHRLAYQYRTAKGDSMDSDSIDDYELPIWLRLVREGNQITASYSSDGSNWEVIETRTIELDETMHAGLVVSSNDKDTLNETIFQLPVEDLLATD
jgi:regulation of enolase protein 1 (concanavalin A-like superfamily)